MSDQDDRRARIQMLEEKLLTRGALLEIDPDFDDEMTESFLDYVLRFELAPRKSLRDCLAEIGYAPAEAGSMDNSELTEQLWTLIRHFAFLGVCLEHTDHLEDRQLYAWLTDPSTLDIAIPLGVDDTCHIDVIGGFGEEESAIYLMYYASEDERARWKSEFPNEQLPPHAPPICDRDAHLPKPHTASDRTS